MIYSMTGFGKGQSTFNDKIIQVEIKSLNSKHCDINLKLNNRYRAEELNVRNHVNGQLVRGKIEVIVRLEEGENSLPVTINRDLAAKYLTELKNAEAALNLASEDLFRMVLNMPDVIKREKEEMEDGESDALFSALDLAIVEMMSFRRAEGEKLAAELRSRIESILNLLEEVKAVEKERIAGIKERIQNSLSKLEDNTVDQNRYEQELIYYLEKLDVTEEKVRLKAHCDYFLETMEIDFSGKKLGFIGQEIGREVNTLGSKSNHAGMQRIVVQMKDELEKIKEQVLNVL